MTRWLWVSRRAYDAVVSENGRLWEKNDAMVNRETYDNVVQERDRLVEQNTGLIRHERRMERVANGLPEMERKKREELGEMPFELQMAFKGYRPTIRKLQEQWASKQRKSGRSWESIIAEVQKNQRAGDGND